MHNQRSHKGMESCLYFVYCNGNKHKRFDQFNFKAQR